MLLIIRNPWERGKVKCVSVEVKDRLALIDFLKRAEWIAFRLEGPQEVKLAKKALEIVRDPKLERQLQEAIKREEDCIMQIVEWFDLVSWLNGR